MPTTETKRLSPRQREVVLLLAAGLDSPAIALQLHRSVYTIQDHMKMARKAKAVRTCGGLAWAAIRDGDIPGPVVVAPAAVEMAA